MSLQLTVADRDAYVEIIWTGTVPPTLPFPSPYDSLLDGTRVLVDATGITGAQNTVLRWAAVARRAAERRLKIAVLANPGLILGLFRQALYAAGVDQEFAVAIFVDRADAEAWLATGRAASVIRGGR